MPSRLLIVDDDPVMLTALSGMVELRLNGVTIDTCESATAALEYIGRTDYDAIVSDVKMPGMDGFQLMERVLTIRPTTPTLLVTGHGDHDMGVKALNAGAYAFIPKPIDRDYFIAWLKRAIQLRQLSRAVEEQNRLLERTVQKRTAELEGTNQELKTALEQQRDKEEALRESEERYRLATRATSDVVWDWDMVSGQVVWGGALHTVFGYPPEQAGSIIGDAFQWWTSHIYPDDRACVREGFQKATEQGKQEWLEEYRFLRADGTYAEVSDAAFIVYDERRKPVRIVGAMRDITERKQTEQLLIEQKQVLEGIASGRPLEDCLTLLTGAVTRLQPDARAGVLMADEARAKFEHAFTAHIPPSFGQGIHGAPINELAIGTCGTAVYAGEPITCADIAGSEQWSKPWRDLCAAHGVLAMHSTPVLRSDGTAVAFFFICFGEAREPSDWERRLAEFGAHVASIAIERDRSLRAMQESEARLRLAFNAGKFGHWQLDLTTMDLKSSSQCKANFGRTPDEPFTYEMFRASIHPDDREIVGSAVSRAIQEVGDYEADYRCVWPDGSVHWINARSRTFGENDQAPRMDGVTLDITERKRAEQLETSQKQVLELIAHDAPLSTVCEALVRMLEEQTVSGMLASILLLDDDGLHLRYGAAPNLPEAYNRVIDGIAIGPKAGSCGTAAYRKEAVYVADIAGDPLWSDYAELALSHCLRACWSTPIVSSTGRLLGTLAMYYPDVREPNHHDLRLVEVATRTAAIAIERKQADEALRRSETQLEAELFDTKLLQALSTEMTHEENVEAIYEKIVDAAVTIMRSDFASMQMLYPERGSGGELRLLASRGFSPEAVKFWEWVRADSGCICGAAFRTGRRAVAPDVERCEFMTGTDDLAAYLQADIHAAQSTPLRSRSGKMVGMIATHWRKPHQPSERDLRLLDILTRQAADLIERRGADDALRLSHAELRAHAEELTRFNRVAVSRELRMIELKEEVNDLCKRLGEVERYPLDFEQAAEST